MGAPHPFDMREDLASQGPFAVSGADPDIARGLIGELTRQGARATRLDAMPSGVRTVILTEGLSGMPVTERHWQVLHQCRKLHDRDVRIVLLQAEGAEEFDRLSGLAGLSRSLRQEWPGLKVAAWSLPAGASVGEKAALVLRALVAGIEDADLTADGFASQEIGSAPCLWDTPLSTGNVWFAPGGARGVTSACVMELARRQPGAVFILAGRSGIAPWPEGIEVTTDTKRLRGALIAAARGSGQTPSLPEVDRQARSLLAGQEIRTTLDAVASVGAQAVYLQADMSDQGSIRSTVGTITQRYGAITGLVHGAGVLADGLALKKTREDVAHVFGPKVEGLATLLSVLDTSRLRHVGLFSSASAVFGNTGQSDYAMANAWLGAVARKLTADLPEAIVKSFCWGPWAGGMVDASLAGHFAARGISLIDLEDGARIFADQVLQGDRSEVEILIGDEWAE